MSIDLTSARLPDGMRIYAIGDVHGYVEPLQRMHELIEDDLATRPADDWRIVHVGDYVDRGPDAKGVIDFLLARVSSDPRVIALRGNHDQGLLDFLQAPDPLGLFATNGGAATARSYGTELDFSSDAAFRRSARIFAAAVPAMHTRFLAQRPYSATFGDYFFCHAGVEPGVPLADQKPRMLMWIRDYFLDWTGLYEKIVVHGHTPAPDVEMRANRINVDTGIFVYGQLSAVMLEGNEQTVMTVRT